MQSCDGSGPFYGTTTEFLISRESTYDDVFMSRLTMVGLAQVVLTTNMCHPSIENAKSNVLTLGARSTLHHPAPGVSSNWVSFTCSAGSVDSEE